jgi:hypothetical protein
VPDLAGIYPAPTYHSVEWRDFGTLPKFRVRCAACDKVVFTEERARRAAEAITASRQRMRAYLGRCGHWHLTKKKKEWKE